MQYNKKISEDNRGFSLLELIVTVVILALVTAPFLSSFVTASNTNVKSKRIQEANELGQYVLEQCKAMSLDKINEEYSIANIGTNKWVLEKGKKLPGGYSDKFTAELEITPSVNASVNDDEAIPVIDNIHKNSCAVLREKIYNSDIVYSDATKRKLDITIDCNDVGGTKSYSVNYVLGYYKDADTTPLGIVTETYIYEDLTSVYILYTPKSGSDEININNEISTSMLSGEKINVYLMQQNVDTLIKLSAGNIKFKEKDNTSDITLSKLLDNGQTWQENKDKINNTVIYTNVTDSTVSNVTDRSDVVNNTVQTIKIETVYDIDVVIKYDGKEVSKFNSSKVQLKK